MREMPGNLQVDQIYPLKGDATLNSGIIGETCQSIGGERLAEKWSLAFQLRVWCSKRNAQTDVLIYPLIHMLA